MAKDPESPSRHVLFCPVLNAIGIGVVKCGDQYRCLLAFLLDLEIIGLAAVVVEVAISADPNFVFSTWIRRVIVPENSKATGTCLQN